MALTRHQALKDLICMLNEWQTEYYELNQNDPYRHIDRVRALGIPQEEINAAARELIEETDHDGFKDDFREWLA